MNERQTGKDSFNVTEKKPTLYVAIMALWILILAGSASSLWRTLADLNSILAKILFVFCAGCLAIFWFYGVYHTVFLIFSYAHNSELGKRSQALAKKGPLPKVAVIYTTYSDFNREAALTCLRQDYIDYRVFLLDVSTNPDMRKNVDAFHQEFVAATTLVRLQPRQGFKARSLNDTLKSAVGKDYELFAVCDADNRLPSDFLSRTIPYFSLDKRIAFVQANHNASKHCQEKFARDFEVAIDASWYRHQLPRDRYGLLMCMGHGVIVRRDAWEKVGGYPEIVQEDTAFTMRLREHGYYGCFAPEVICKEEFPEDFRRFLRRQFRLIQADTEILFTQIPAFVSNKSVSLVEKLDLLARTRRLPSQALTLPFLVFFFLFLPVVNNGRFSANSIDTTFTYMLSPWLVTVTLLTAFAPLYPFLIHLRHRPLSLLSLLFHSITLHYPLMSVTVISLIAYLLRGKAMFLVTGAQDGGAIQEQPRRGMKCLLEGLSADSPLVIAIEIGMGLALGWVGLSTGSLVFLGIALTLILSPMIRRMGWGNRVMAGLVFLPPLLVVVGLLGSSCWAIGAQSQYLALAVLSVLLF